MLSGNWKVFAFHCLICSLFQLTKNCNGASLDEELTLTLKQKLALDKFREKLGPRLTQDYMSHEIYLIRWLRDSKFNEEEAESKLISNLEWRKANQIDQIEFQDWSNIVENYPYTTDVYDKEERPTFAFSFGDWDIQRAVISGQSEKLVLLWAKVMEELMTKVRRLQSEGHNVTQCNFIIDSQNYNLVQHGCNQCIRVYVGLISLLRNRYPGDIYRVYLVNAPRIFELLLQILRPFMGPTGDAFHVYGPNKREWSKRLQLEYSKDQLPYKFGGTKETIDELN